MTPLTSSRVPLLLETTKVMQPACSAAKIRGRTAFCHGEAPDWVFWHASAKVSSGKFRSIDFGQNSIDLLLGSIDRILQNFRIFQAILHEFCHSSLIDLQNIKTQKLTKASENYKAKGLTYVNQGVQIDNIWHSSIWASKAATLLLLFDGPSAWGGGLFLSGSKALVLTISEFLFYDVKRSQ
jgi:hypothetical protein